MAIVSTGYDGVIVTETKWASLSGFLGAPYGLTGSASWKVTSVVGLDRTVRIAAGTGYGHGVLDVSDATVDVQLPTVASGTRWDLIVARRDWQPPGGVTVFTSVQGTATRQVPAGRLAGPGVQDDQPLALVQLTAGQTTPTAVIDLRQFTRKVTTMAADALLPTDAALGTVVCRGAQRDRLVLSGAGVAVWLPERPLRSRWDALRRNESAYPSGVFGQLEGMTISGAPAGEYAIDTVAIVRADAGSIGYLRVLAGGVNLTADLRRDLASPALLTLPFHGRHVHAGGDMDVSVQYKADTQTIYAVSGSAVCATWLGPLL